MNGKPDNETVKALLKLLVGVLVTVVCAYLVKLQERLDGK